jgi:hypothetical protein
MMAKAFKVERRGRKAKPGKRYPSGDIVQQREVMEARVIAFRQPHRQEAPESKRDDPKATWPLGILNLIGRVTDVQYQAGVYYGGDVRRYRAHYLADVPDPSPSSIAGFMQPSHSGGRGEIDVADIKKKYESAVEAVMGAGQRAAKAVARMAVFGERCPIGLEHHLILGLDKLVLHYGLTRRNR